MYSHVQYIVEGAGRVVFLYKKQTTLISLYKMINTKELRTGYSIELTLVNSTGYSRMYIKL